MGVVRIQCPQCGAGSGVEEQSLGRRGRCRSCGHVFALVRPGGDPASAASGDASAWKGAGAPPTPPPPGSANPADLPEQFGRYRILRRLGAGGMGAVYLAEDVRLRRRVALKVPFFHPVEGAQAVARFEREARAAAALDHPNLCPIHDVGEVDGVHYLTMPYIEGRTLSEAMPSGPTVPEAQAAAVARKLALALGEAHALGVVHRDLKPSNVMVSRRRELIVMDFGLARVADDAVPLTISGNVLGTALYMAPEQAAGRIDAIGPACDVYSLGVILYELLTGVRPFEGPWSLVIGLKSVQDPEPPSAHRPGLSPGLDAACLKAIARAPADRFGSMAEFAAALAPFAAPAPGPVTPAATAEAEAVTESAPPPPESLAAQFFAGVVGDEVTSLRGGSRASKAAQPEGRGGGPRFPVPAWIAAAAGAAAVLLGIILYVNAGDSGRIRIEVDDPGAVVRIDGRVVRVEALGEPITLSVGEHELIVHKGNDRFTTRQFTVSRGENPVLRASLEPHPGKAPAAGDVPPGVPTPPVGPGVAEVVVGDGRWAVEGRDLVLTGGPGEHWLLFGDPAWTDYDFEFLATQEQGVSGLRALYRSPGPARIQQFNLGWIDFKSAFLEFSTPTTRFVTIKRDGEPLKRVLSDPIRSQRAYRIKVVVRGATSRAYCDDSLIFETNSNPYDRGRVGFGTWYGRGGRLRIRDIRVRGADGSTLWEGPPEVRGGETASPPIADGWPAGAGVVANRGDWKREGSDLVQASTAPGDGKGPRLIFGNPLWSHYDLAFQAKTGQGIGGFDVAFHWADSRNHRQFRVGQYGNKGAQLVSLWDGNWGRSGESVWPDEIKADQWYPIRLEVRGTRVKCFFENVLMFDESDPRLTHGKIGLMTWGAAARFRDFKVTAPDGEVLWEGFPDAAELARTRTP